MQTIITITAERKHTNGVISKSESISDSQLKTLNYPLTKWFEETFQNLISELNGPVASQERNTAVLVIDFLNTRKNFGAWWDTIDRDTKNEILEEIAVVIRREPLTQ